MGLENIIGVAPKEVLIVRISCSCEAQAGVDGPEDTTSMHVLTRRRSRTVVEMTCIMAVTRVHSLAI